MRNTFVCRTCGHTVTRPAPQSVYCSRVCMAVDYRTRSAGEANPAWRGGKWNYKGRRWRIVADAILQRDGRCVDCGTTDGLLVHHLIPQRFWVSVDAANSPDNLVALCSPCHARRPEHYWVELPAGVWHSGLLPTPPIRARARLRPYPRCLVCGESCKRHRARFCSYACSNKARWRDGTFGPEIARNITRTRWEAA